VHAHVTVLSCSTDTTVTAAPARRNTSMAVTAAGEEQGQWRRRVEVVLQHDRADLGGGKGAGGVWPLIPTNDSLHLLAAVANWDQDLLLACCHG
jgi:hypothetical protein